MIINIRVIIQTAIQNGINVGNYFSPSRDKQSQARLIVEWNYLYIIKL